MEERFVPEVSQVENQEREVHRWATGRSRKEFERMGHVCDWNLRVINKLQ
jgi:hypothetical protein